MTTRARKIPELPAVTSISNTDLLIIEKVTNATSSNTSKVTASALVNYLITTPLGFSNVAGNIIPANNAYYNIGSNTKNWSNLYVSNTLFLNNTAITINANGVIAVGNTPQNTIRAIRDAGTTNAVTIDFAVDETVIYNPTSTSAITLANVTANRRVELWVRSTTTNDITHGVQANQATGASLTFTPVSGAAYKFEYLSTTSANSGVYVNIK